MSRATRHQVRRLAQAIRPERTDREILLGILENVAANADAALAQKALEMLTRDPVDPRAEPPGDGQR